MFEAGGRRLIDGLDLTLRPGVRTVVMGPNGAGKSLMLRLLHGLLHPTAGDILWDGRPADGLAEPPSGGVAFSPDGAWVAFSTGGEVLVFAGGATEPVYTLPIAAGAVAWR